eukprot:GHVS01101255.1.p2 GENE.GHVS01101255.1~~GHVS01101255.1.p2  ORF type:complete len:173 (+),score=18.32 GHVS01101255.1:124-642(+)
MWTLSQWGWPLCGLFLVLVSMEISLCSSRMMDKHDEILWDRAGVSVDEQYSYHHRLAFCLEAAMADETLLVGITPTTTFQCIKMAPGMPTICNIAEMVVVLLQPPTNAAQPPTNAAQPPTNAAQPPTNAAQPPTNAAQQYGSTSLVMSPLYIYRVHVRRLTKQGVRLVMHCS